MIEKRDYFGRINYIISSDRLSVSVIDYGCTCLSIKLNGRELTLGLDSLDEYIKDKCHLGVIVGRYGNRIEGARCWIGNKEVVLESNEGCNQLHGGPKGFDKKIWTVTSVNELDHGGSVRFECLSPDGENGYPGNLRASVTYEVDGNNMYIYWGGISDADTIYAPTTHMYFNLGGEPDILKTKVRMCSDTYLAVNDQLIPTEICNVDKYFDFREKREIQNPYDHCFIINENKPEDEPAFEAESNGVCMSIWTDYPGLQFYTGKKLRAPHHAFQGFAIEPEAYPNSPNRNDFPSSVLKANVNYTRYVKYCFTENN